MALRLLASTDFALRVLMRLSTAPDTHVSTDELARELAISRNHLHKIVQRLTAAGLVRTIRGSHGGVMLAKPASKIKVGEVIRSQEQDQALVECFRPDGACNLVPLCRLRGMLDGAKSAFYAHLDRHTLADCVGRPDLFEGDKRASRRRASRRAPSPGYADTLKASRLTD
jgi:Rrf2 family nitric oxide-sensitive transcriptional repressor